MRFLIRVSISWARFCLFKQVVEKSGEVLRPSFNLLGEILSVQAREHSGRQTRLRVFQSLGRDSVCSSEHHPARVGVELVVSISWARFCLFKPLLSPLSPLSPLCFNLLGEILSVQAIVAVGPSPRCCPFQSLGRDSVCSSQHTPGIPRAYSFRFNLLGEILSVQARRIMSFVAIGSGFQSLGRDSVCSSNDREHRRDPELSSFNLLGEILSVQACLQVISVPSPNWFQSLGRDSVCSSWRFNYASQGANPVSISWARFCLFKLSSRLRSLCGCTGFNLLGEGSTNEWTGYVSA